MVAALFADTFSVFTLCGKVTRGSRNMRVKWSASRAARVTRVIGADSALSNSSTCHKAVEECIGRRTTWHKHITRGSHKSLVH